MATFRSKNRISRKDKKRIKKTGIFANFRQVSYFFGREKVAYEMAKEIFEYNNLKYEINDI